MRPGRRCELHDFTTQRLCTSCRGCIVLSGIWAVFSASVACSVFVILSADATELHAVFQFTRRHAYRDFPHSILVYRLHVVLGPAIEPTLYSGYPKNVASTEATFCISGRGEWCLALIPISEPTELLSLFYAVLGLQKTNTSLNPPHHSPINCPT